MTESQNTVETQMLDPLLKNMPENIRESLKHILERTISYTPKIGVMGKSGAGKSSLVNAIVGRNLCKTGSAGGCTREFQEETLKVGRRKITFMDLPGIAENIERQDEYVELYKEKLPELDIILWVIKIDDRANVDDERFYNFLVQNYPKNRVLFVLSQSDKVNPRYWDYENYKPKIEEEDGITQIIQENVKRISESFDVMPMDVIPVACEYDKKTEHFNRYHFDKLVERIIERLPKEAQSSFYASTEKENRTEKAKEQAKEGFIETIDNFVDSVIENLPLPAIAKIGIKAVKDGVISSVKNKWDSWFN